MEKTICNRVAFVRLFHFVFILLLILLFSQTTLADGSSLKERVFTQPTGESFKAYRWQWGNAQGWETEDGFTFLHDTTNSGFVYATKTKDGALVPTSLAVSKDEEKRTVLRKHLRPSPDSKPVTNRLAALQSKAVSSETPPDCLGTGTVSGVIRDSNGNPMSGALVWAARFDGWWYEQAPYWAPNTAINYYAYAWFTYTDAQGIYTLPVNSGFYEIHSTAENFVHAVYPQEVEVGLGVSVTGVDIVLQESGQIIGFVTNPQGNPVTQGQVEVLQFNGNYWDWVQSTSITSFGSYGIGDLLPGSYRMSFKDTGYAYEFFENAASIDTATDVSVMAGATTRIDAQMDSGGSISGRVTDVNGSPLEWVQVSVYDSITSWYIGYVNTDSNGNYQINGLRTGSYFVEYWDTSSWTWFYYENSTSMDTATAVAVIQGIETPNIDGQFSFVAAREKTAVKALGTIEGAITDEQGTPLPGVWTQLYRNNGGFFEWVDSGNSDDSGHYVFSNVSSGTYAIEFQQNGFKREFYNDAYSAETATPIVLSDTPITNIDVQLYAYPYSINGKVTASGSGIPLEGIYLSASTYMGGFYSVFEFTSTDVCGNYSVAVDPGDYLLQTQDWYNRWATTYNNQLDIVGTSLITVTSSDQVLDVQLGTAGKVTGVVKDANGNPVGNIDVYAYKWNGVGLWVLVAQASTAPDGSFNLDGVTGTVRLQFNDYQTGQTYFYPGTTNSENADDIYVDTGTTLALEMSLIDYSCYTGNRGYSGSVYADRRVDLSAEGIVFNSGSVDVQPGATLGFTSPVQIILNPGFHAMAGSTFTATIAPVTCN